MEKKWKGKIFFVILKSAALVAVVLAGLHFREADLVNAPSGTARRGYSDFEKKITGTEDPQEIEFPQAQGEVLKTYEWEYRGKKYSVSLALHSSIYEFYRAQPKSYSYFNELPSDWEEEYYGMFTAGRVEDLTISRLAEAISAEGERNKLSQDQLAELAVAFVQSIPYDDQKAANILSSSASETMNYPYETLFGNFGVCSDKSFLAVALLEKLGFGTALFAYDDQNHMAVGIQCPLEYSNYGSGYCFAETTSIGNKIGIVSRLKAGVGSAAPDENISFFNADSPASENLIELGEARIFQRKAGKEYGGIVGTIKTNEEIAVLKKNLPILSSELKKLKVSIDDQERDLEEKKNDLDDYLKNGEIERYNEKAKKYKDDMDDYEDDIRAYNEKVKTYNEKVSRYNRLIKL